ncbi:MAG: hypothetical protein AABY22_11150 [Nanoarchaeota archaeon]
MSLKSFFRKLWNLIWKDDSPKGWIISLIVIFILVKFVFFPVLNLATGTKLPLVVVESCSMYHKGDVFTNFDGWWQRHVLKYDEFNIEKQDFEQYKMKDGFNKGDIIFSIGVKSENVGKGDVIIFQPSENALKQTPIIHRIVQINSNTGEIQTIGDNNKQSLTSSNNIYKIDETSTKNEQIIGRAVLKIPYLGWAKLVFFDWQKQEEERGLCNEN